MKARLLKKVRRKINRRWTITERNGNYHLSYFGIECGYSKSLKVVEDKLRNITINKAREIFGYRPKKRL